MALGPLPNNNGLTPEQNSQVMSAINKLRVHDLLTVGNRVVDRLRPRATKPELQKALYIELHNDAKAKMMYNMLVQSPAGLGTSIDMSRRGQNQQTSRVHPYSIPGRGMNGHNGSNYMPQQHQMHNVMPMMQHLPYQQHHLVQQQQQAVRNHHSMELALMAAGQATSFPGRAIDFDSRRAQHRSFEMAQNLPRTQQAPPFLIVPLPFYDVVTTLLSPMELFPSINGAKQNKTLSFTFLLTNDQMSKLSHRGMEPAVLPRFEVQLRFFNITEANGPQRDEFPLNCLVRLNDNLVSLPNVIPTNKPNTEPKRPSRPVNLTLNVRTTLSLTQRLYVEWLGDRRTWAAAVYFVHRVNSDILFKRLDENQSKHRMVEETRQEIVCKLTGSGDDDIAMDHLNISLLDPLIKTRMVTPARCIDCTHLQCFDLMSYLMMNEKKPTWTCPVCSGYCPYDRLIVDDYFREMLHKVDKNTTEVELKQDGSYDVLRVIDFECLSDDDEVKPLNVGGPSSSNGNNASEANGGKSKKKPIADDDIITLSDDDDDDLRRAKTEVIQQPVVRTPPRPAAAPVSQIKKTSSSSDQIEVITLDDTPPRPAQQQPPVPMRQISQPTSSNQISSSSGTSNMTTSPSIANLSDALAQIGGDNASSSTRPLLPTSQPGPPSLLQQYQMHQQQHVPAVSSQYGYPQQMMHQPFQTQNGLIGRSNQMVQMQPPQNSNQILTQQYYQPQMNSAFYYPPQSTFNPQYRQN